MLWKPADLIPCAIRLVAESSDPPRPPREVRSLSDSAQNCVLSETVANALGTVGAAP